MKCWDCGKDACASITDTRTGVTYYYCKMHLTNVLIQLGYNTEEVKG